MNMSTSADVATVGSTQYEDEEADRMADADLAEAYRRVSNGRPPRRISRRDASVAHDNIVLSDT